MIDGVTIYSFDDDGEQPLPPNLAEGIKSYIEYGVCGDFLQAVFENNLSEAYGRADHHSRHFMYSLVSYMYNKMPAQCWGSKEKVAKWIETKTQERLFKSTSI